MWAQRAVGVDTRSDCDEGPVPTEENSDPRPCWASVHGFDVFEEISGRFLGQVELPAGFQSFARPAFLEDGLIVVVQDEAGTLQVERYRLMVDGRPIDEL